jgi:hypothetical protein
MLKPKLLMASSASKLGSSKARSWNTILRLVTVAKLSSKKALHHVVLAAVAKRE